MTKEEKEIDMAACCVGTIWDERDTLYGLKPLTHEKYLDYKVGEKVKLVILSSENV